MRPGRKKKTKRALKGLAAAMSTALRGLPGARERLGRADAEAVRSAAGKLREAGARVVCSVRELAACAPSPPAPLRAALASLRASCAHLSAVCLQLMDRLELGRYRLITAHMKRTGEAAALLVKTPQRDGPEVARLNRELAVSGLALAAAVVRRVLKCTSGAVVAGALRSTNKLVSDLARLSQATQPGTRGPTAKAIILGFRDIKQLLRTADSAVTNELRDQPTLIADTLAGASQNMTHPLLLSVIAEARSLGDAEAASPRQLAALREMLGSSLRRLQQHLRALAALCAPSRPRLLSKLRFCLAALQYHLCRLALLLSHSALSPALPTPNSLRPAIALDALFNLIAFASPFFPDVPTNAETLN